MSEQASTSCCPLCQHTMPAEMLRVRLQTEAREIRDYTIKMIRTRHPDWVQSDGACPRCWQYYQRL
jgi:transposase